MPTCLIVQGMTSLGSSNNCKKTHSRNKLVDLYHIRTRESQVNLPAPPMSGITANVDQQSSSHSSINELCCPQLVYPTSEHTVGFDVHHSLFTISDHISHVGSLSLFSKFPLARVRNTRTYNQGMTKQLSPIDYPIKLSPR